MSLMALLRRPFIQEGARVFVIMGAGDVIAQTVVEKKSITDLDLKRTAKFASVGFLFVGPSLRIWYGTLEKIFSKNQKPMTRAFKKMSLDQLFFAPIFTAAIIGVFGKVNGESNEEIQCRLKNDYTQIMMRNYMLWPAAQMINFALIPISYQVIFAQFVAIIWNTYISMVLNKK